MPDELVVTHDEVYLRFHGTKRWYRHDYTTDELAAWVQRVREADPSRVWAYFNNDRECYAIKNAREFMRQYIACTPLMGVLSQFDGKQLEALEREIVDGWQPWTSGEGLRIEQFTLVSSARRVA